MTRWTKRFGVAVVFGLLFVGVVPAGAGALDPTAFAPVGPFPTAAGTYAFYTSGPNPTLLGPGTVLTGVDYNGIAVFDFNAITVGSDQTFVSGNLVFPEYNTVTTPPLALLSRGDIAINGTIDVSGNSPTFPFPGPGAGGPGGFGGGSLGGGGGPGAGASGGANVYETRYASAGGGGFGGRGGNGGLLLTTYLPGPPYYYNVITPYGGGSGGGSYGNLAISLQGGSGGGTVGGRAPEWGGGGGGAIEVGAVGGITVRGGIYADGGSAYGGGGGSGGGIFLHGDSVALSGVLSAQGGGGGLGGGGGGGQVFIQTEPGGFTGNVGGINVSGGSGSGYYFMEGPFSASGASGVVDINGIVFGSAVPEPASLVLLGIGLLGLLACARNARLRATT